MNCKIFEGKGDVAQFDVLSRLMPVGTEENKERRFPGRDLNLKPSQQKSTHHAIVLLCDLCTMLMKWTI
jgi:hypothetical protein